jgi:nicotinamide riboside kinase
MRIALCGAHRTGKSTIAQSLQRRLGLPYIASSVSSVAKDMGVNLKSSLDMTQRIAFQQRVLEKMDSAYGSTNSFVTDRSPLDAAAYLLADATSVAGSHAERAMIARYVENALRMTERLFDVLILVQPGIPYIDEPGKPPKNEAYQEHIHFLIAGMVADTDMGFKVIHVSRDCFDHRKRVDFICETLADVHGVTDLEAEA